MLRKAKKTTDNNNLPPRIDVEISELVSKLATKPALKKGNIFGKAWRAMKEVLLPEVGNSPNRIIYTRNMRNCRWQLILSIVGWFGGIALNWQIFLFPRGLLHAIAWLVVIFVPSMMLSIKNRRVAFWFSTFAGLTGLPLLVVSNARLSWYALAASVALPVARAFFITIKIMLQHRANDTLTEKQRVIEQRENPVRSLQQLVTEQRIKIIGRESEFGMQLEKLESRLSQIRINEAYWTRRHTAQPDSALYAARLEAR